MIPVMCPWVYPRDLVTLIIQEVCCTQSVVSATLRQSLSILGYLSSGVGRKQVVQASQSAPTLALKSPSKHIRLVFGVLDIVSRRAS